MNITSDPRGENPVSSVHWQNHSMNFHQCHKQDAVVCETQVTLSVQPTEKGYSLAVCLGTLQNGSAQVCEQMFVNVSLNLCVNRISR